MFKLLNFYAILTFVGVGIGNSVTLSIFSRLTSKENGKVGAFPYLAEARRIREDAEREEMEDAEFSIERQSLKKKCCDLIR